MAQDNTTKQGELLSTFNDNSSKRTPIQSALTRPLIEAVGKCFLLLSGTTEEVQDSNDETKTIPMAIDPANINVLHPNAKALVVFPFKLSNIV